MAKKKNEETSAEELKKHFKGVLDVEDIIEGDNEIIRLSADNIESVMVPFKTISRDGKTSRRRSKVYFCAHPDDMQKWLKPLSDCVLGCESVDIYYTDEPQVSLNGLGQRLAEMSVAIVPVTAKLLSEKNRVIDFDLPTLTERGVTVLPVLIDGEAEQFNSLVGTIEAIDYNKPDFKGRLEKFLKGALIGGEQRKRIENEFSARVFLSYRKKDILYAKKVIADLRKEPQMRDVIIWYDDYLTAGEDFNDEIKEALVGSDMMLLLVTPNLVTEENYVNKIEYPLAVKSGVRVLPVQAKKADENALNEKFASLSPIVDGNDKAALFSGVKEFVGDKLKAVNDSPEHVYYIGLAYYFGVCVDADKKLGLELLAGSAEAGYLPAIERLNTIDVHDGGVIDGKKIIGLFERGLTELRGFINGDYGSDAAARFLRFADGLVTEYITANRIEDAEKLIAEMLSFPKIGGERKVETLTKTARLYFRLAVSKQLRGDLAGAESNCLLAQDYIERVFALDYADKPNELYIHIYGILTQIYAAARDYKKAFEAAEKIIRFMDTLPDKGNDGARRAFAQFVVNYLNICFATGKYNDGLRAVNTALKIMAELPESNLNLDVISQLYNVLGVCYFNAAGDNEDIINRAIDCMYAAVRKAEKIDEYNPAGKYFRLAKYSLSLANVMSQYGVTEHSTPMFENIISWCEEYGFNLQQRYLLYRLAVNSLANDLVAGKEYEKTIALYDRFIERVQKDDFAGVSVAAECANFRFRGSYVFRNYLFDRENEAAWLMSAAEYLSQIEVMDEATKQIAQMVRKALANLKL